jgi:hypothetical protein
LHSAWAGTAEDQSWFPFLFLLQDQTENFTVSSGGGHPVHSIAGAIKHYLLAAICLTKILARTPLLLARA